MHCLGAVSYTHLDVYKRQIMGSLFSSANSVDTNERDDIIGAEATRNVKSALDALKNSRKQTKRFDVGTPTWTGKFGRAGKIRKSRTALSTNDSKFARKLNRDTLEREKIKREDIQSDATQKDEKSAEVLKASIEKYLSQSPGFASKSADLVIRVGLQLTNSTDVERVRKILKDVAVFDKLKKVWVLKSCLLYTSRCV